MDGGRELLLGSFTYVGCRTKPCGVGLVARCVPHRHFTCCFLSAPLLPPSVSYCSVQVVLSTADVIGSVSGRVMTLRESRAAAHGVCPSAMEKLGGSDT